MAYLSGIKGTGQRGREGEGEHLNFNYNKSGVQDNVLGRT